MKKILQFLSSTPVMSFLLLSFAFSCAMATFIENDFGTQTARAEVYAAGWFNALMGACALSFLASVYTKELIQRKRYAALLFHSAFVIILIGGALTRFVGFEGSMHIREGESENRILSSDAYLMLETGSGEKKQNFEKKLTLSASGTNSFEQEAELLGKKVQINLTKYVPNAVYDIVEAPNGEPVASMIAVSEGEMPQQRVVKKNDQFFVGELGFFMDTNDSSKKGIHFFVREKKLYFKTDVPLNYFTMKEQTGGTMAAGDEAEFAPGRLYSYDKISFVARKVAAFGKLQLVSAPGKMGKKKMGADGIVLELFSGGKKSSVELLGEAGVQGEPKVVELDGLKINISYGSKPIELPFALKLAKFNLERYPGSMSPSSYESEVVVADKAKSVDMPYKIYMNHTLDYGGYRFFQSSYDQDEKGTILSVSSDPGKLPTYLGYLLLGIGLIWSLISPTGRFAELNKSLKSTASAAIIAAIIALAPSSANAAPSPEATAPGSITQDIVSAVRSIDKESAGQFGKLLVQDSGGRIKPINTLSSEILYKVAKTDSLLELTPEQIVLGMLTKPRQYQQVKMIKVSHPQIYKLLGLPEEQKRIAFADAFDFTNPNGSYRLARYVDEANRKKPSERDTFDKELLKLDERLNICYMVFSGQLLKIFPKPNDPANTWADPATAITSFAQNDAMKIRNMTTDYFNKVDDASIGKSSWAEADKALGQIAAYQMESGKSVIPEASKIDVELFFNKAKIFQNLALFYTLAGLAMLFVQIAKLLYEKKALNIAATAFTGLLFIGFAAHTINLGLRWYISGHAPWSDGYESLVYIAWATALAGFAFSRRSAVAFALTSVLAGIMLAVAHLSWMDPQITNLVPVLKSYWLVIHVATITASYGFFALSAMLGLFCLAAFSFRKEGRAKVDSLILELSVINEMSLLIGLAMLSIGNFLGGVWANESWGRYWGWDAKETWALISILVYATLVHVRYMKPVNYPFLLSAFSVWAFSSILMTYFGVNFYLSGLHSYAAGDPVPVPWFVYAGGVLIAAVNIAAYRKKDLERA